MPDYDDEKIVGGLTERESALLPNWAQERLRDLRSDAEDAERKLKAQLDSTEPTMVAYGDVYDNPKYLPDGRFDRINVSLDNTTGPVDGIWASFCRREDEVTKAPYVEISTSRSVAVVPQASNVVRIYPVDSGQLYVPE